MSEDLLKSAEVSQDYLRVHVVTLYRLHKKGLIPAAVRVGRQLRWRRSEIEDWLANRGGAVNVES